MKNSIYLENQNLRINELRLKRRIKELETKLKEQEEAINYTRCCDELICDHCENIASVVMCRCDKCDSNIH